jgi:catalase
MIWVFSQRDLIIDAGNFPQWNLKIQVMTEEQANSQDYYMNPFDVTRFGLTQIIR